ncbi:MAG: glycosyltransferase family 4 protein [Anaerolineales bacterium]|nr:glycosyltransferase family 4 protein [Anaerolineales bacterium]
MKVLFLLDNFPASPNFRGGGPARFEMYFRALKDLGVDLYVWRSLNGHMGEETKTFERTVDQEHQRRLRAAAAEWIDFEYELSSPPHNRQRYVWIPRAMMVPLQYTFGKYSQVQTALGQTIDRVNPDLIWANHMVMGGVMALLSPSTPWVYSHHDWHYRLKAVRAQHQGISRKTLRSWLFNWIERQAEFGVARKATAAISGSLTEAGDIERLGTKTFYIPTCYDVDLDYSTADPDPGPPRIVHFGGMKTTANRIGLERYLDVVHQAVVDGSTVRPELWIVGALEGADERLIEKLRSVGAVCTGYVSDLSTVFRPYDIAIVPYEHNTGNRTRVPLLLAHRQTMVAVKETVRGFPEVVDGQNAVLVDTLEQMKVALTTLIADVERRKTLGTAAEQCFRKNFVLQAQIPKFEALLSIARRGT